MKKIFLSKKFYMLILTLLSVLILFALNASTSNRKEDNNVSFMANTNYYDSNQSQIIEYTSPTINNSVNMADLYTRDGGTITYNNKAVNGTINITSSLDLYAFSVLANSNASFLTYNYQLLNNIDYSDTSYAFIPIAWKSNTYFTGTFNGNGYEISNLKLVTIDSNVTTYDEIQYFAMFSRLGNKAVVSNFGLINTNIVINKSFNGGFEGVAVAVGLIDTGATVEYVFARDLRDPVVDEAGITAAGGHRISGLVFENKGTMTNCYTVYNIIVNYTIDDYIDFSEILSENSGTAANIYFYNKTITSYSNTNGKYDITYGFPVTRIVSLTKHYGTYCTDLANLNTTVLASSTSWHNSSSYGELSGYLSEIITPVTRGIIITKNSETHTFSVDIHNEKEFSYIFELMNLNAIFATEQFTYNICHDINLSMIASSNYYYPYNIDANFIGQEIEGSVTLKNGSKSNRPTIYHAKLDKYVTTEGIDCYGVFPWVTGEISDLNFVIKDVEIQNDTNNLKSIGVVCGYADGAKINNVNTFIDGSLSYSNSIGKYFTGGIVGVLSGQGSVTNSTSAGNIEVVAGYSENNDINDYMTGCAIGGAVGYITSTTGNVSTVLSTVNITTVGSNYDLAVGGILGGGYTNDFFNIENQGNINIGAETQPSMYTSIYVAGIIGRHLGLSKQINAINNKGNITLYSNPNLTNLDMTYLAGILNADIVTIANNYLAESKLKTHNKHAFLASSCTNSGDINCYNQCMNLEYTSGININSKNGFISKLSGIYNKAKNNPLEVDMSAAYKYAAVLNVISNDSSQTVDISTVYNLRNINFTTKSSISSNTSELLYSGCVLGQNINYTDVRNEGNLTFSPLNDINCKSIITVGVFEETSPTYHASSIYNGGDIKLDANVSITGNIYFSGICHANKNGYTEEEMNKFNPLSSSFDKNEEGSLNNVINNGDLTVTNSEYENIEFTYGFKPSSNGFGIENIIYEFDAPAKYINGDINISGIVHTNESVITNTFNLGDILNVDYANGAYSLLSSGISNFNISKYSYILNSANNGVIKTMNLSSATLAKVYSSGISCRNDKTEAGANYQGGANHVGQIISFTINYGSIFSYNYAENISSSADEPRTNSSGILSFGLCNIINVVNYGNIYSSETASGIFGVVYFETFANDVSASNVVSISNSINYANVYVLEKGDNLYADNTSYRASYSVFKDFTDANINNWEKFTTNNVPKSPFETYGTFDVYPKYAKLYIERVAGQNFYIGSIFSLVNFNNDAKANYVKIRYLISFNENQKIVAFEAGTPSNVNCDVSKIYSSYYTFEDGMDIFSTYMGKNVTYAPLSSEKDYKLNSTNYVGVFSNEFDFRKAIEGKTTLDIQNYPTDQFITDYFQYVNYQKINPVLLDKIGWRTLAYLDAANRFALSLEGTKLFYTYYKNHYASNYPIDVNNALSTGTWSLYADTNMLLEVIEEILNEGDPNVATQIVSYFFNSENTTLIDNTFRQKLIDYILTLDPAIFDKADFLTTESGYSSILAEILCSEESNEVKEYIKGKIDAIITDMSPTTKEQLLIAYNDYLSSSTSSDNNFFDSTSSTSRYNILNSFFDTLNNDEFYNALLSLLKPESVAIINNSDTVSSVIKQYDGYERLTDEQKKNLFGSIIDTNGEARMENFIDANFDDLGMNTQLGITDFNDIFNLIETSNSSSTNPNTIDQRVQLYNQIKNTTTFKKYLNSFLPNTGYIIEKATEHNNTFQSNLAPNNNGAQYPDNVGYSYIEKVTPSTYFYGPYDNSGNRIKSPDSNNSYTPINNNNYGVDFNIASHYRAGHYHVFITTDLKLADEFVAQGLINPYRVFMYEYGTDGAGDQFTALGGGLYTGKDRVKVTDFGSEQWYYKSDFTGCQLREDKYLNIIDDSGEEFSTKGASISPIYLDTKHLYQSSEFEANSTEWGEYFIIDANGKKHLISTATAKIVGSDGRIDNIKSWYELYESYGLRYYFATPTEKYNTKNGIENAYGTGIILYWENKNWFILNTSQKAAKTSQYIKYNTELLAKLDGVYSTYGDHTTKCEDERNIINSLFKKYFLSTTDNADTFKKIIKKSLFETLGTTNDQVNISFVDKMINTNINYMEQIEGQAPLSYLYCNDDDSKTTTVASYLESKYQANNKTNIVAAASTNKSVYCDLLNVLFKKTQEITSGDTQVDISGYDPTNLTKPVEYMGVIYNQSFKFDSMEVTVGPNDKRINLLLLGDGGTVKINYEFLDSTGQKMTTGEGSKEDEFKDISTLPIDVPTGATKLKITTNSKEINVFSIYAENLTQITYDPSSTVTYTGGYIYPDTKNSSNNYIPKTVFEVKPDDTIKTKVNVRIDSNTGKVVYDPGASNCYTLPTEEELKNEIGTATDNANGTIKRILSVVLTVTVKSSSDDRYFIVSPVAVSTVGEESTLNFPNHYGSENVINANETETIVITDAKNYLGEVITILANNGKVPPNWGTGNLHKDKIWFSKIEMTVIYETDKISNIDLPVTTTYERSRSLLESVDEQSLNIIKDVIDKNQALYDDFLKNLIVYMTPLNGQADVDGKPNEIKKYQELLYTHEFYKLLAKYSNEFILKYIEKLDSSYHTDILNYFVKNNYNFFDSFVDYYKNATGSSTLTDTQKQILTAAYLSTDYKRVYEASLVDSATNLSQTLLYDRLSDFDPKYKYINSNGTIDNAKFDNFAALIGYNTGNSGYGIYALSSSKGILNGEFIPDNLALDDMKAKYNESLELTDELSSNWRGGNATNPNDTSDANSVNYAFLVDMKQLIKSISTTIFTLDLIDNEGTTHYSSESTINLDKHTITYYVPKGYFETSKTFEVDNNTLSIANLAELTTDGTLALTNGTNSNVIHVAAEDRTVKADYSIIFEEIDISFGLKYDDESPYKTSTFSEGKVIVKSTGDVVDLKLTSPENTTSNPLPKGMDLKPYISIIDSSNNEVVDAFEFVAIDHNHIIEDDGTCSIVLNILPTLHAGNYKIRVKIFNVEKTIEIQKLASSKCEITSFVYEGSDLIGKFDVNKNLTTMIDFGRAYDYSELSNINAENFYLNSIEVSEGATIGVTAEYSVDGNNIATYVVTYTITAENGAKGVYTHNLVEKNPLSNYDANGNVTSTEYSYATVYKDGTSILTPYISEDPTINVSFNRGEEPQYRVKYALTNLYTDAEAELNYSIREVLPAGYTISAAHQLTYAGIIVTVTDDCDAGDYTYYYTYSSKGVWNTAEYQREFTFPALVIDKSYSTDALVKKLTFMDSNATLASLATIINPEKSIRPVGEELSEDEDNYFSFRNGTIHPAISLDASTKNINYKPNDIDYATNSYNDYFAVGTISNANLSDYAPTFTIESHAEIYQYTTLHKLKNYGKLNNQTGSDYVALNNHDSLFIYVPYENTTDHTTKIFLIQVENGKWTNVYNDDFNGTGEKIATLSANKGDIVYNGVTYVIGQYAGTTSGFNNSLYMDYIGTPLDNHFWYVSYVVFSEEYLRSPAIGTETFDNTHCKFYHISLIDTTNTIYFDVTINTPVDFELNTIYLTISENIYTADSDNNLTKTSSKQISAYAEEGVSTTDGKTYLLSRNLQVLPSGYFYFYVDLPDGYVAKYTVSQNNQNDLAAEAGAYLPPSSIVTQKILLTITIEKSNDTASGIWGVSIADIFTRQVTADTTSNSTN